MAVTFDNKAAAAHSFSATTLTTAAFTVGAGTNRAGALLLSLLTGTTPTSITGNIAGVSASAVAGTSQTVNTATTLIWQVIAPTSGASKTGVMAWTTAGPCTLSALTAANVDQATPITNGTVANTAFGLTVSKAVTSTSGDLTFSIGIDANGSQLPTTNQTSETADTWTGCDIGPGTGTTTHTWTCASNTSINFSGANFKQVSAGAAFLAAPNKPILQAVSRATNW